MRDKIAISSKRRTSVLSLKFAKKKGPGFVKGHGFTVPLQMHKTWALQAAEKLCLIRKNSVLYQGTTSAAGEGFSVPAAGFGCPILRATPFGA
ncbi:MAG TPA: hypothetical protein VGM27_31995 [Acidobacteriaceae bacterium]